MVAAWRWDAGDQFPNGRRAGRELVSTLRKGPPWPTLDVVMRAVVADLQAQGRRVAHVSHHLAPEMFMDDAHLVPAGNEAIAADFVAATIAALGATWSTEAAATPQALS